MGSSPNKRSLKIYRRKRDFMRTPEPSGEGQKHVPGNVLRFCVQKHLASQLHYDFRLEYAGVLLSWSVPKGPSLQSSVKRLAVRTEDHPLDYGDFEGVIPSGYGAGIVMLWDKGIWTPETTPSLPDIETMLRKGEIKFSLEGMKLKGSWVLVRTRAWRGSQEQWLLIKHKDKWAGDVDITEFAPKSVKSFGDFPEILNASDDGNALMKSLPVRKGKTHALFREVIEGAGHAKHENTAKTEKKRPALRKSTVVRVQKLPAAALEFGKKIPKLTNPSKVYYPKTGFTKGDMIEYYRQIAPMILPHLRNRATTLKRYPDGVEGKFFFQKRCASHRPDWVQTARVEMKSGEEAIDYCVINDISSLIWAANSGAIELHVPLALADRQEEPVMMVFDLDPGAPAGLKECAAVAVRLRDALAELQLESLIKSSGGKGIHMAVPLNTRGITFDQTKAFSNSIAQLMEKHHPKDVTTSMSKAARPGKVFIDWSQNHLTKTTACAFTLRAQPTPNISWPLNWKDVEKGKVTIVRADQLPRRDRAASEYNERIGLSQKLPSV